MSEVQEAGNPVEQPTSKAVRENTSKAHVADYALVFVILVFVGLYAWVHRDQIKPIILDDVAIVKKGPFPDRPITPIGKAYESLSNDAKWKVGTSPKGVQFVEVEGHITDEETAKKLREELYNMTDVCKKLPAVAQFLGPEISSQKANFLTKS
jgi:hypothetical protein